MVHTRHLVSFIAGGLFGGFPAFVFCQDDEIRALVGSLASEDFRERTKAQRDLSDRAMERPASGQEWLFREFEAAGEPEVRIRLREVLKEVVVAEHQKDGPGYVGIGMADVEVAVPGEDNPKSGVSITRVQADTPASRAGLRIGDVVTAVDRTRWTGDVAASFSFQQAIMKRKPGETVQLEVLRGGEIMMIPVTLAPRPMGLPEVSKVPQFQGFQGLQVNPGIRLNFLQMADDDLKAFEEKQKADEVKAKEDCFQAWLRKRRGATGNP